MPRRPAVEMLPEEVRAELNRRLERSAFSGYESLSEWLAEQGFEISKSALHRYGTDFKDRCQALRMATEQAKAIVEETPDDEGAMSEALMRLVQEKLFSILLDFEVADPAKLNLSSLARSIAELGRASVTSKKYAAEVRAKAEAAAQAVDKIAAKGGLSAEARRVIEDQILGVSRG